MMDISSLSVQRIIRSLFICLVILKSGFCEIEYNNVNSDGSFSFRHTNDDIGSYYHAASGNPNTSVRGRYGSRNPSTGRVEETVYTAGPRGFRVNGPQVHRKMDLSQIPRGPIGNADDPLADPFDDPSYGFSFKTPEYSRNEDADSTGRVRGLYSYFDDIGEKHTVRYAAGAGTGFEILNSIPDTQSSLAYTAPLYKASSKSRGKTSVQRNPNGVYKFVATSPDQRRSEASGPDGIIRGAYSYLDDKGVQRTVQYEAGAGIGYRVVQNSIGRGSHINTFIPTLRGDGGGPKEFLRTAGSGRFRPHDDNDENDEEDTVRKLDAGSDPKSEHNNSHGDVRLKESSQGSRKSNTSVDAIRNNNKNRDNTKTIQNKSINKGSDSLQNRSKSVSPQNTLDFDYHLESVPPIVTGNRKSLEISRDKDWKSGSRDSTIITNVGKWYIGLPPGQSVRAHVQNIDLLPIGGRILSPSEALKRDELADVTIE